MAGPTPPAGPSSREPRAATPHCARTSPSATSPSSAPTSARGGGLPAGEELDDAVQEVFVDFFKPDGVLGAAIRKAPGAFGRCSTESCATSPAAPNESQGAGEREDGPRGRAVSSREESLSVVFDRAWAHAVLRDARQRQRGARRSGESPPNNVSSFSSCVSSRASGSARSRSAGVQMPRTCTTSTPRRAPSFAKPCARPSRSISPNRHDDVEDEFSASSAPRPPS